MALPMKTGDMYQDEGSERTDDVQSYKITCMDFVQDISRDYLAWVDYYKLDAAEDRKRRTEIASTIKRTNDWIAKIATTIRGVDVVMNDGIQKMAEATAGRPFQIGVFVNKKSGYTAARPGLIDVLVRASGRNQRSTALGFHFKQDRFRIESTAPAFIDETALDTAESGMLDTSLKLDASKCTQRDIISFTVTVCELESSQETERRGVSTIVHIV